MAQLKLNPAWHTILTHEELRLITIALVGKLKTVEEIFAGKELAAKLTEQRIANHRDQLDVLARYVKPEEVK